MKCSAPCRAILPCPSGAVARSPPAAARPSHLAPRSSWNRFVASVASRRVWVQSRSHVLRALPEDVRHTCIYHGRLLDGVTLLDLEKQLSQAIDDEEYDKAAMIRDSLVLRRQSTVLQVERANEEFYDAFRRGSKSDMNRIWGVGEYVQCIHPGGACIAGSDAVRQSWEMIFGGGMEMDIELRDVRVMAGDSMGFVTCVEVVTTDERKGRVVATNVFERNKEGEWKIVNHHGSHMMM